MTHQKFIFNLPLRKLLNSSIVPKKKSSHYDLKTIPLKISSHTLTFYSFHPCHVSLNILLAFFLPFYSFLESHQNHVWIRFVFMIINVVRAKRITQRSSACHIKQHLEKVKLKIQNEVIVSREFAAACLLMIVLLISLTISIFFSLISLMRGIWP